MAPKSDKGFPSYLRKIRIGIAGSIAVLVVIGLSKPDSPFHFPPAGSLSKYVISLSFLLVLACLSFPWFIKSKGTTKILGWCAGLLVPVFLVGYFFLVHTFVVAVDIPAIKKTTHAIIGYQRSAYAEKNYPGLSDYELLKQGGSDEAALRDLYTGSSRFWVVFAMFLAYAGLPSAVAVIYGCACRRDQL